MIIVLVNVQNSGSSDNHFYKKVKIFETEIETNFRCFKEKQVDIIWASQKIKVIKVFIFILIVSQSQK